MRARASLEHSPQRIHSLREAVARLDCSSAQLEHARALNDLGAALAQDGSGAQAREAFGAGLGLALACGAVRLAGSLAQRLASVGPRS